MTDEIKITEAENLQELVEEELSDVQEEAEAVVGHDIMFYAIFWNNDVTRLCPTCSYPTDRRNSPVGLCGISQFLSSV